MMIGSPVDLGIAYFQTKPIIVCSCMFNVPQNWGYASNPLHQHSHLSRLSQSVIPPRKTTNLSWSQRMEQMLVTVDLIQKVISTVMAMAISFN